MCVGCWEDAGKPAIDTPAVREAADAVTEVYLYTGAGGNLHIVIDDWNVEDPNLEFCMKEIVKERIATSDVDDITRLNAERDCCNKLMALSEAERYSALAFSDGLWGEPCEP